MIFLGVLSVVAKSDEFLIQFFPILAEILTSLAEVGFDLFRCLFVKLVFKPTEIGFVMLVLKFDPAEERGYFLAQARFG